MALMLVRKGVTHLAGCTGRNLVAPVTVLRPQVATIVSKVMRSGDYKRPVPFPYKDTKYGFLHALLDKTSHRFDDNSKVIVVDGAMATGKTKFAKEVAEELDMLYVPEANMDMVLINQYGYDMRQLDPQMPQSCKSFDIKDFLKNPTDVRANTFQLNMFNIRLEQYIDALIHLFSTGQGVVLDRSVYSDLVFAETMAHFGYMTKGVLDHYYEIQNQTLPSLMRPHLAIYLDVPVDVALQKIKDRNLPHEVNSPVCTPEFLSRMEHVYKQRFLKLIGTHSQILVYDWSDGGETEVVVEDIERLNFDFDKNSHMMSDWIFENEWDWCERRMSYTQYKDFILRWSFVPNFKLPEINLTAEDSRIFEKVWKSAPGMKYEYGYNEDMGDTHILLKTRTSPL